MIPESDKERLARANMNGIGQSVNGWEDLNDDVRQWYRNGVKSLLSELTAMGYVVAKLEGRVNEQDRKPPEDAA